MEFKTIKLGDIYEVASGLSKSAKEFGNGGYPFLSFKTIFYNYFLPDELPDLANTTAQEQEKCSVLEGDIFLTRTSETADELGMSSVALKDYPNGTFNGFSKRLRKKVDCKYQIYPKYMGYFLRSRKFRNQIDSMSIASTRASLNIEMINRLTVDLPILDDQIKIADFLFLIDEKIKNNNTIDRNLSEQQKTLVEEFLLDNDVEMKLLPDVATIKYGKGLPTNKLVEAGYPVFGGNGVIGYYSEYLYKEPQILISCRGAASGNIWESLPYSYVTSNSLVVELNDYDYFEFLKQYLYMNPLYGYATGSAQPQITIDNIKNVEIPVPDKEDIKELLDILHGMSIQILNNNKENVELAKLRDTLLPKLMSGELDVSDLEI